MKLQHIEYLKQFRKQGKDLPFEDREYKNIYTRHFTGNRREKQLLEKLLEKRMTHSWQAGGLIAKIEGKDVVIQKRLTDFMRELLNMFDSYRHEEHYDSPYLSRLTAEIHYFMNEATQYQDKTQSFLLNKLKNMVAEGRDYRKGYFSNNDIREIEENIGRYLDTLYCSHDAFSYLLQQEKNKFEKIKLISEVEGALFNLTELIKNQIIETQGTFNRLDEWKKRLHEVEEQDVYN